MHLRLVSALAVAHLALSVFVVLTVVGVVATVIFRFVVNVFHLLAF